MMPLYFYVLLELVLVFVVLVFVDSGSSGSSGIGSYEVILSIFCKAASIDAINGLSKYSGQLEKALKSV